ncbi:TPA: hypothetical protein GFX69_14760 [Escherichia coli]|nr:hypothetical protein [Escherichia coli]
MLYPRVEHQTVLAVVMVVVGPLVVHPDIVIAPLIAPFVTGYVNTNYHPCGNNTGISPGAIYIKNGMKCNNGYISRKEDSAVK